jgi:hypothetical protein
MLTEQTQAENESMTRLTTEIQNDSKFIKVLAFLTMLYTPASLMAVSDARRPNEIQNALLIYSEDNFQLKPSAG